MPPDETQKEDERVEPSHGETKKEPQTRKEPSKQLRAITPILRATTIIVLLALAVYLEFPHDSQPPAGSCELTEAAAADESEAEYAQIANSGYRDLRSRWVTVVYLQDGTDPARVLGNVCEQRWYMAKLVKALEHEGATEIIIDKFYGPDACEEGDKGTSSLKTAMQLSDVPVIVGRATHVPMSDRNNTCLILSDSLDFGNRAHSNGRPIGEPAVEGGLTRLNSDIRKIPLDWSCYSSDAAFQASKKPTDARVGTLSWIAASTADSGLSTEPRLIKFRDKGQHPFTTFIDPQVLPHADALSILCASDAKPEVVTRYRVNCDQHPRENVQIRGRIAVVGEDVPGRDQHILFGKPVSGVYLQANYIESLLDDRFMKALSPLENFLAFALWLVFLYIVFWIQPEAALLISMIVALLIRYLVIQLVVFSGFYPHLWVLHLGLAAMILKYIDSRGHLLVHAIKEHEPHNLPDPK